MRHSFETEVFKYMATIRKRSDGTYQIRVSCGYGVDGKQRNQFKSYKPEPGMTPKQIEKELTRQAVLFEEECKRGQITSAVKFEKFAEQWFEEYAKVNLRPTSYARMKQLTKRVYPAIGHKRLDKITARDIQKFVTDMLVNGKNMNTGKPLSRKTAVHHLSFISDVFSYAIRMGMLTDNPCRRVYVPKQEQDEKQIYTIDEVKKLYENLRFTCCLRYTVVIDAAKCWDWSGRTSTLKTTLSTSAEHHSILLRRAFIPIPRKQENQSECPRCLSQ